MQEVLERISPSHRQPPLVFAVARMLGSGESGYPQWREWVLAHSDRLITECAARSLQTNEPLRCAALLPALAGIDGPIALLEVGASAGLCLYPDRYSYRYRGVAGEIVHDPRGGASSVVLESELRGSARAAAAASGDRLAGGHRSRTAGSSRPGHRIMADRSRLARRDRTRRSGAFRPGASRQRSRPSCSRATASDQLAHAVAAAPPEATLVVQTPGVLAHLGWHARHALIEQVSAVGSVDHARRALAARGMARRADRIERSR